MLLPHGVPPRPVRRTPRPNLNGGGGGIPGGSKTALALIILSTAIPSFFLGTLVSLYSGIDCQSSSLSSSLAAGGSSNNARNRLEADRLQAVGGLDAPQTVERFKIDCPEVEAAAPRAAAAAATTSPKLFPEQMKKFIVNMARVSKEDFLKQVDPGTPIDHPGSDEVLILYQNPVTLPNKHMMTGFAELGPNPLLNMPEAIENCQQINLVLSNHDGRRRQCLAIMPQYESYHVQRWLRWDDEKYQLNKNKPLQMVSRGLAENGRDHFNPPELFETKQHWNMLQRYFDTLNDVTKELNAILKKIAIDNTVVVMVCNFGQIELLMNFVCSSRARNFDLSNVIVFTTDQESTDIATGLGLNVYYDYRVRTVSVVVELVCWFDYFVFVHSWMLCRLSFRILAIFQWGLLDGTAIPALSP